MDSGEQVKGRVPRTLVALPAGRGWAAGEEGAEVGTAELEEHGRSLCLLSGRQLDPGRGLGGARRDEVPKERVYGVRKYWGRQPVSVFGFRPEPH